MISDVAHESSASVEEAAQRRSGYSACANGSNIHTKKRLWTDPKNVGLGTVGAPSGEPGP